ncbi:MAG: hypothetical protein EZS28_009345 [Streblomastix strix]|uniref:Uncharacterized protein n=1 Tax=Streblomastix strix TaxID=222440 RepID=A0A5J4WJ60_9EUKA|nr:MAG: hypothetical protein EZS28_009345 [Streblomastix strix]
MGNWRSLTQANSEFVQVLFGHLRKSSTLDILLSLPIIDDSNANKNDFNIFASNREITVIDADAGPALKTMSMQEIQYSYHQIYGGVHRVQRVRKTFLCELNRSNAFNKLHGTNLTHTGSIKERRDTFTPKPDQHRKQLD